MMFYFNYKLNLLFCWLLFPRTEHPTAHQTSLACTESFSFPDVFLDTQKDGYVDVIRKLIATVQEKFTGAWTREVRQVG